MKLPVFRVSGPARERGRQYGALAREQIENTIRVYQKIFYHYANLTWDQVQQRARVFIPIIESFDPEIMEEIRGVAMGCNHLVEDIVALNSRTELMYGITSQECTAIGAGGAATGGNGTIIGQNWDWKKELRNSCVILEIVQPPRPTILMMTEAGIVGKIGLNDAGLGVCLNLLVSDSDGSVSGVPIHIMLRGILNSRNIGNAVKLVAKHPRAGSSNYLIGERTGQIVSLEVSPKNFDVLFAEDGIMIHTNHFISPIMAKHDTGKNILPDSLLRLGLAKQIIREEYGKLGVKGFKKIFRDHTNFPNSICRHADPADHVVEQIETVCSIIMDLESNTIYLAHGQPCQEDYNFVRLGETTS